VGQNIHKKTHKNHPTQRSNIKGGIISSKCEEDRTGEDFGEKKKEAVRLAIASIPVIHQKYKKKKDSQLKVFFKTIKITSDPYQ